MSIFGSLVQLASDAVRVVTAPVEVVVDLVGAGVKPIADTAQDIVDVVKDMAR